MAKWHHFRQGQVEQQLGHYKYKKLIQPPCAQNRLFFSPLGNKALILTDFPVPNGVLDKWLPLGDIGGTGSAYLERKGKI